MFGWSFPKYLSLIVALSLTACGGEGLKKETPTQIQQQLEADEFEPDYAEAAKINAELGIEYLNKNMLDLAKSKLLKALKQDEDSPKVYYALGLYYARSGQEALAKQSFKKALQLAPNDYLAMGYYAQFMCEHQQTQQAVQLFQQALAIQNNEAVWQTYEMYGSCVLNYIGDKRKAVTLFEKAINQNPDLAYAHLQLAQAYYDYGMVDNADQMLKQYLHQNPPTKDTIRLAMNIASARGHYDQAATLRLILVSRY